MSTGEHTFTTNKIDRWILVFGFFCLNPQTHSDTYPKDSRLPPLETVFFLYCNWWMNEIEVRVMTQRFRSAALRFSQAKRRGERNRVVRAHTGTLFNLAIKRKNKLYNFFPFWLRLNSRTIGPPNECGMYFL